MKIAKKRKLGCLAQRRVQPWRCPPQKRVRRAEVTFSDAADVILHDCARVVIHTVSNLCPHYPFVTTPLPHDASLDDIADAMEVGNEELPYSVQSSRDLIFGDEHRRHDFEAYNAMRAAKPGAPFLSISVTSTKQLAATETILMRRARQSEPAWRSTRQRWQSFA